MAFRMLFKKISHFILRNLKNKNNKGGCCKNCSSVTHFLKDCPEVQKQSKKIYLKKFSLFDFLTVFNFVNFSRFT
jgi:hypothetical protein